MTVWNTKNKPEISGTKVLADTNVFINLSEGKGSIEPHIVGKDVYLSVVSEIEILGWHNISETDEAYFEMLIGDCFLIELTPAIKHRSIRLKQKHRIKLPDAIIAATALFLDMPLLTFDTDFARIEDLDLILLEL